MANWKSLVDKFNINLSTVEPVNDSSALQILSKNNPEFEDWINEISKRDWRCLKKHEARAYLIRTPKNLCVAWISWLGYRGSHWHLVKLFPLGDSKSTVATKKLTDALLDKYQEVWSSQSSN